MKYRNRAIKRIFNEDPIFPELPELQNLGFGVGLRSKHFPYLMNNDDPLVDCFEISSENFIDNHGYARTVLEHIRKKCPVVMHGVSMNIGSTDPLNLHYIKKSNNEDLETLCN